MLVLVIGDPQIPQNAQALPSSFKKLLVPSKIAHMISNSHKSRDLIGVSSCILLPSPWDDEQNEPDFKSMVLGGFNITACTITNSLGTDRLQALARKHNADILITFLRFDNFTRKSKNDDETAAAIANGDGPKLFEMSGRFFIDPASPTVGTKSFVLMDIVANKLTVYIYKINEEKDSGKLAANSMGKPASEMIENVKVEKMEFFLKRQV